MSGSYLALKQQINQILALTIANGGGGTQNLQQVLDEGNESTTALKILSDADHYTEVLHDPATLVGIRVYDDFFGQKTATLASNTLSITDVQAPNTAVAELGYRLDLNLTNGAAEVQRCLYDTNSINFLSNVAAVDINTLYSATGVTTNQDYALDAPLLTIPGQASFDTPPHSVEPVNGNDLATKGYVDSLVGQYSGGYNFFMNYSVDDGIYKSLSPEVVEAAQQSVLTVTDGTEQVVASFVSGALGIEAIPAGIWNCLIYGQINATAGLGTYFFDLFKLTDTTETLIIRSAMSADINSLSPAAYTVNAAIPAAYPLALTDRIVIRIYVHHDGGAKNVTTYFQGTYYSFSQSTLNAGTTLLGSNNTWTGLNNFVLPPTTPTNPTPAADALVNYGDIETLISDSTPGLAAVLGVSADASGNNITGVGSLSATALYVTPGPGAAYSTLVPNALDFKPATGDYPASHLDINYLSLDSEAGTYARLSNSDTPRLALTNATRNLELTNGSLYVGPGFGSSGQVLTRTAVGNEFEWADIPAPPTPDPIVSTIQYFLESASPNFQYPPAQPSAALIATTQYYGWYFKNAVALRKIDWYFAPDNAMTVSDVLGLYMNFYNVATTSSDALPYISIYTKPTGSGDIIPGFAHSVCEFVITYTPAPTTPYCAFMNISGTQPDPFPYGHVLIPMIQPAFNNPRGEYLPTEEVLAISVGTDSAQPINRVEFTMAKVGICLAQGNQEAILNPLFIAPNLTQVLASGSAAGSQPISGVTTLTATTLSAPTLDASAVLNVGAATALGVNVGRTGQTSDLKGNVRVNGSSGTSGQLLTSTGASTAPTWQTRATETLAQTLTAGNTANMGINMGTFGLSSCASVDSAAALALGGSTATSTAVGRLSQTTDLLGNVRVNGSSGTTAQVLTSTGASTAPTWQTPVTETLAQTLTAGATANMAINMGSFGLTACTSVDSSAALALGGSTATSTAVGRLTQTTDLLGNVRVNGSSGTSGQVLTSTGATTAPTWQAAGAGGSQTLAQTLTLGNTANMGINMGGFGLTNTSAVDASGAVLTLGGTTATSVVVGKAGQTTNLVGNTQLNGVATAGLVYSTGTNLACSATIPIVGSLSFTKATLPTFRIDPTNLSVIMASTTNSASCAMFPDQMQMKDASGNTAIWNWARDGPTTSVLTLTPYTTTELKKATRLNGSATGFVYQNASGYTPTQLVTATTGNAFIADGTTMNNNAIVWITPTAGTLVGRTFRLWTLRTEYVDCYRVSIRNDSGVPWTIIPTTPQIIYGNTTLLSGSTLNYAGIVDNFGTMSYICLSA